MNILITGNTGFVGKALIASMPTESIVAVGRQRVKEQNNTFYYKSISSTTDYSDCLIDVKTVIHTAAKVHNMTSMEPDEYYEVNTDGTLNLARQAAKSGVKRFIFISSVKVNGESTLQGKPFLFDDPHNPFDAYGMSKSKAEIGLFDISNETGMEIVIIRPPLIYGPDVKGNYEALLKLTLRGVPLPFGCLEYNQRSMVSLSNLIDLIITCITHPKAVNQVFLVSDDHDVSTASMVKHMSLALGKSCRLLPVPLWCYRLVAKVTGKTDIVDRLLGSLQVDITHTKNTLGWTPPQSLEEGFKETAEAFLLNKN
ncbi:UDP-glucose 4-epimerase family protein [Shewanella sp. BJSY2023SW001]|uniref:UDP-glucose 4-epimerase family protein n=1 Tax=Shewanella sp. BJSY2023SW001 TaxID=3392039 RepID=UPI0039B4132E